MTTTLRPIGFHAVPVYLAVAVPCPVCRRYFRTEQGRGGHLATLRERRHAEYRRRHP